ncbi:MAG: MCE family protein [Mycobacteriaceae bacterium]
MDMKLTLSCFWKYCGKKISAIILISAISSIVLLSYFSYKGAFSESVNITIESGRAGLVMQPGSLVKMHGVEVGRVTDIRVTDSGARIDVRLNPDHVQSIPATVSADILSLTAFGSKSIVLKTVEAKSRAISDGAVIHAESVTVEINSIFESLTEILREVQPEKLNSVLGAIAQALRGNGTSMGEAIDNANSFLTHINPSIPELSKDISTGAEVIDIYAQASPQLINALKNISTTAKTISQERVNIDSMLLNVVGMADLGLTVLGTNADPMMEAISLLRPTSDLLALYSPMFTCFLEGADETRKFSEKVSGGNGRTMLLNSTVLLGVSRYTYPDNLPIVKATGGPRCGALPEVTPEEVPTPYLVANTGSNPFATISPESPAHPVLLLDFLFGNTDGGK